MESITPNQNIIALVSEIQRQNSTIILLQRGGVVEQTKNFFKDLSKEKQETFNQWIEELIKRLESKINNKDVLRVILNLVEDVLYYNQEIDRKRGIEICKEKGTLFAKEIQHSLENPVWQMF
jgi:hypothetical protein